MAPSTLLVIALTFMLVLGTPPTSVSAQPLTMVVRPGLSLGRVSGAGIGVLLTADVRPPQFWNNGRVLINPLPAAPVEANSTGTPGSQFLWLSCVLESNPPFSNISVQSPFTGPLAQLLLTRPTLVLAGGNFTASASGGAFSFVPDNAFLVAAAISGPLLGQTVALSNFTLPLHVSADKPAVGTLLKQNGGYALDMVVSATAAFADLSSATGVNSSNLALLGAYSLTYSARIVAGGRVLT